MAKILKSADAPSDLASLAHGALVINDYSSLPIETDDQAIIEAALECPYVEVELDPVENVEPPADVAVSEPVHADNSQADAPVETTEPATEPATTKTGSAS